MGISWENVIIFLSQAPLLALFAGLIVGYVATRSGWFLISILLVVLFPIFMEIISRV